MIVTRNRLLFRRVAVVGIGLIGGSVAMAMKKNRLAQEVIGVSRRQTTISHAIKEKIIDRGTHDLKQAVENADLVILALPVKSIISVLSLIGPYLKRGCLVTDVGSSKGVIVEAAQKYLPPSAFFIGSHPLAGSEKRGIAFSDADLFINALCILTPTDKTNRGALERIKSLWVKVGAQVKTLTPAEHDKMVAYISHAPHLIAYGLMATVPQEFIEFAATGFKDTTRIASSDPKIWNDICMENSKNIIHVIDEFVKVLAKYRKFIASKDEKNFMESLNQSKTKRDGL